jgi:hypothetical protein
MRTLKHAGVTLKPVGGEEGRLLGGEGSNPYSRVQGPATFQLIDLRIVHETVAEDGSNRRPSACRAAALPLRHPPMGSPAGTRTPIRWLTASRPALLNDQRMGTPCRFRPGDLLREGQACYHSTNGAWYGVRGSSPLFRLERPAFPAGKLTPRGGKRGARTHNGRVRTAVPGRLLTNSDAFRSGETGTRTLSGFTRDTVSSGAPDPAGSSPWRRPGDSNAQRGDTRPRFKLGSSSSRMVSNTRKQQDSNLHGMTP